MPLSWNDLRVLSAVHRLGKVGAAARELGVAPSTLYRSLASLEEAAGEALVVRGGPTLALTEAGKRLARVGRHTEAALAAWDTERRAARSDLRGEVTLTTVHALAPFVARAAARLARVHPDLVLSLHLGDAGPSVRRRQVDLALGVMFSPPEGCVGKRVARLDAGVFGVPALVDADDPPFVVRALDEASAPESAWERAHVTRVAARAPFHALPALAARGLGLALLPRRIAALDASLVESPRHRASVARLARPVWVLMHPASRKSPRLAAVTSALAAAFDEGEPA